MACLIHIENKDNLRREQVITKLMVFVSNCVVLLWLPVQLIAVQVVFTLSEAMIDHSYRTGNALDLAISAFLLFVFVLAEIMSGIYVVPVLVEYWRIRKQVNNLMKKIKGLNDERKLS